MDNLDENIFSEEYNTSESTNGDSKIFYDGDILESADELHESEQTNLPSVDYSISKPQRKIIKAKINNDKD